MGRNQPCVKIRAVLLTRAVLLDGRQIELGRDAPECPRSARPPSMWHATGTGKHLAVAALVARARADQEKVAESVAESRRGELGVSSAGFSQGRLECGKMHGSVANRRNSSAIDI